MKDGINLLGDHNEEVEFRFRNLESTVISVSHGIKVLTTQTTAQKDEFSTLSNKVNGQNEHISPLKDDTGRFLAKVLPRSLVRGYVTVPTEGPALAIICNRVHRVWDVASLKGSRLCRGKTPKSASAD